MSARHVPVRFGEILPRSRRSNIPSLNFALSFSSVKCQCQMKYARDFQLYGREYQPTGEGLHLDTCFIALYKCNTDSLLFLETFDVHVNVRSPAVT